MYLIWPLTFPYSKLYIVDESLIMFTVSYMCDRFSNGQNSACSHTHTYISTHPPTLTCTHFTYFLVEAIRNKNRCFSILQIFILTIDFPKITHEDWEHETKHSAPLIELSLVHISSFDVFSRIALMEFYIVGTVQYFSTKTRCFCLKRWLL